MSTTNPDQTRSKSLAKRLYQLEHSRPPYRGPSWSSLILPEPLLTILWTTREERKLRRGLQSSDPLATAYYLAAKWLPDYPEKVIEGIRVRNPSLDYRQARILLRRAKQDMCAEFKEWYIASSLRAYPQSNPEQFAARAESWLKGRWRNCYENPYSGWANYVPLPQS